ncbi:MAG: lysophospholipid acyltransferase family protein [Anaerolineae bacterium]
MAQNEIIGSTVPGSPRLRALYTWLGTRIINLTLNISASGLEHTPASGPLLVVANHVTFSDPMVVMACLPRTLIPMAKVEIFENRLTGWLMKSGGGIPVHRGEADMSAVKLALSVLKQGGAVLLAPEGTRSHTGQLQPAKDGATMLALRGNAAILPVGVSGIEQARQSWRRLRRPAVRLSVGPPFRLRTAGRRPSREEMSALTTALMFQIAAQLPPEYRGRYSDVDGYQASPEHARLIAPVKSLTIS